MDFYLQRNFFMNTDSNFSTEFLKNEKVLFYLYRIETLCFYSGRDSLKNALGETSKFSLGCFINIIFYDEMTFVNFTLKPLWANFFMNYVIRSLMFVFK